MSLNTTSGARICPECGARNSGLSLFCAECGASLNNARSADMEEEGQTTTTFTPASQDDGHRAPAWNAAKGANETQEFTPQLSMADTPGRDTAASWDSLEQDAPYTRVPSESRRGFVLGLLAGILMALVIGFFLWSTVADQAFRDAVTGLFR